MSINLSLIFFPDDYVALISSTYDRSIITYDTGGNLLQFLIGLYKLAI